MADCKYCNLYFCSITCLIKRSIHWNLMQLHPSPNVFWVNLGCWWYKGIAFGYFAPMKAWVVKCPWSTMTSVSMFFFFFPFFFLLKRMVVIKLNAQLLNNGKETHWIWLKCENGNVKISGPKIMGSDAFTNQLKNLGLLLEWLKIKYSYECWKN